MKPRNYTKDVKPKLLNRGYIILSADSDYKNMTTNIIFKCNYCDAEYKRTPKMALKSNCGCVKCIQKHITGKKLHEQKFDVDKFMNKYKDKLIDLQYKKNSTFIYKCSKCNSLIQRRADRIENVEHKDLCNLCGKGMSSKTRVLSTKEKNEYLKSIGSETICIEEDETKNNKHRIKFQCSCGEIFYRKWNIVRTVGSDRCLKCSNKQSKGELILERILQKNQIEYEKEKRFDGCRNKQTLPFDFYLPQFNTVIEFDGQHHYKPIRSIEHYKKTIRNDNIKNNFCKDNKINLIRIPYWERDNMDEIILNNLYGNTEPS